jgi:3-methyladenine DNA glycosylase/8-oxoguanine DNA glycosylase
MVEVSLNLATQEFRSILLSHAWFELSPFVCDPKREDPRLFRNFSLPSGSGSFEIYTQGTDCILKVKSRDPDLALTVAEKCLSLDLDTAPFYAKISGHAEFQWMIDQRMGRYLRSPTLFEDCFKIIATSNADWFSRTKPIVQSTVESFGSDVDGRNTFPTPEQILNHSVKEIKTITKCGYRGESFHDLAQKALGQPDLFLGDRWRSMSAGEFYREIMSVTGIGPANATYLCRFYGRPHDYTIDSWIIKRCEELWGLDFNDVEKKYSEWAQNKFGDFAPYGPNLLWFSITKYRHEIDGPFEGKWWDI